MLLYRVFPYLDTASPGEPGAPDYLHRPQGGGRLDNADHYDTWYFATAPEAAVGEVFADLPQWRDSMFEFPSLPGARRALGVFEVPDDVGVLDLDDARNLVNRGLRPTQVIARNRPATQEWALEIYRENRWAGVKWWSFQRPHWTIIALWAKPHAPCPASSVKVEYLGRRNPVVNDVSRSLGRVWV